MAIVVPGQCRPADLLIRLDAGVTSWIPDRFTRPVHPPLMTTGSLPREQDDGSPGTTSSSVSFWVCSSSIRGRAAASRPAAAHRYAPLLSK